VLLLVACAITLATPARSAAAQDLSGKDFSGKPIRMLVGLAAGGRDRTSWRGSSRRR